MTERTLPALPLDVDVEVGVIAACVERDTPTDADPIGMEALPHEIAETVRAQLAAGGADAP